MMVFFLFSLLFFVACIPVVIILFVKRIKSPDLALDKYKELCRNLLIFEIISILWGIIFCCEHILK